jgi:hypothetical protein
MKPVNSEVVISAKAVTMIFIGSEKDSSLVYNTNVFFTGTSFANVTDRSR